MAKATSPTSGQPYGIRRVCQAWGVARSSFYAAQAPASDIATPATPPARRGPKPAVPDGPCSPPSARTSPARPGPVRAIARSGPACACATPSASPPGASCA
jgi:hypothetical protein